MKTLTDLVNYVMALALLFAIVAVFQMFWRLELEVLATVTVPWFFPLGAAGSVMGFLVLVGAIWYTAPTLAHTLVRLAGTGYLFLAPGFLGFLLQDPDIDTLDLVATSKTLISLLLVAAPWLLLGGVWLDAHDTATKVPAKAYPQGRGGMY